MPDLTVTLTAEQVTRIRNTFDLPADQATVELWLKEILKSKVQDYESRLDANSKFVSVSQEVW